MAIRNRQKLHEVASDEPDGFREIAIPFFRQFVGRMATEASGQWRYSIIIGYYKTKRRNHVLFH